MKCIVCGRNSESEYCFQHKTRKELSSNRGFKKPTLALKKRVSVGKSQPNNDHLFFKEIWKKRPHESEVSGTYLGAEALSLYFHHILPKSKYPQFRNLDENIILLTADEHANVESDIYRYKKVNEIREYLIDKYKLNI
uniref:Uncharacterized protein n=1 Tax=Virus NIOZ-UU157 TaxID=2763269 RepID=A0A7S9SU74_9VIRU|nr:MAG: hypothetical protein NIOZUU157_00334 [Virus NIOZ-UU157]|tara:strand:- start:164 stop:577 length:414 start_codon:yes stop_codon:yes gene_type:complete